MPAINRDHLNGGWRTRKRQDGTTYRVRSKPFKNFASTPDGVAEHETALYVPGGDAEAHAKYYSAPHGPQASVHAFVDCRSIYQSLEWHEQGWHAGDGMNGRGNTRFIAIEVCTNEDAPGAWANAVALTRWLRAEGHAGDELQRHWDFTRKNCPRLLRHDLADLGKVGLTASQQALARKLEAQLTAAGWDWDRFCADVRAEAPADAPVSPTTPAVPAGYIAGQPIIAGLNEVISKLVATRDSIET